MFFFFMFLLILYTACEHQNKMCFLQDRGAQHVTVHKTAQSANTQQAEISSQYIGRSDTYSVI